MMVGSNMVGRRRMRRWVRSAHWRDRELRVRIAGIALIIAGLYVGALVVAAPHHGSLPEAGRLKPGSPLPQAQLVIGKIGVQATIVAGSLKQLDQGLVIQRTQGAGDPVHGGNFVLVAHRYVFSFLPGRVSKASVFYDLPKLKTGDVITVYWKHKAYKYVVSRKYQVKPNDLKVEAPSRDAKLTLYTCTLQGQADGRMVVEARPL